METKADYQELHFRYFKDRSDCRCQLIEEKHGPEVLGYISGFTDMANPGTEVFKTAEPFNIECTNGNTISALINLKRINDLGEPNELFKIVNKKLPRGGVFIGCVETLESRRRRILNKYPPVIAQIYYMMDFIFKRVFPKLSPTRKIYSILTRNLNRVMSKTEAMGRLVCCGFELIDSREIGYMTYFVCVKAATPVYNGTESLGLFIKMKRVGKDGKLFNVYKFRTMHPYAGYLQEHVHKNNNFAEGCKFKNDFRITSWGRFLRKFWIDEQPMWLNWLRREMKLVGVRPLSEQFFGLYPPELQKRRLKNKPGLIPPFYVDMPKSFEEILDSESKYLDAYEKNPLITDFRYFLVALYNIFIKRARSA